MWRALPEFILLNIFFNDKKVGTETELIKLLGGTLLGGAANMLENRISIQNSFDYLRKSEKVWKKMLFKKKKDK